MDLFIHFIFAFAIYPVKKMYWKKIFFPSLNWGNMWWWLNYPLQAMGWMLILLWLYWGYCLSDFCGFTYSRYVPRAAENLIGIYTFIWVAVVIGMAVYAWIKANKEYESHYRKNKSDFTSKKTELPPFVQEYLNNVNKESKKNK